MCGGLGSFRFTFGIHKGKRIEDVPTSYLKWITGPEFEDRGTHIKEPCMRELAIRPQEIFITDHALDRCSQRLLKQWQADRQPVEGNEPLEGIAEWLRRKATEALKVYPVTVGTPAIEHEGIKFAFEKNGGALTLVTVIKK